MKVGVLSFLLMFVGLPAYAHEHAQGEVRYFAGMAGVITPMMEYIPKGEIDAEKATIIDHYRVVYDADKRLKSIKYFSRGKPSNEAYFQTHEVRYSYPNSQRIREYFGADGAAMAMWRHYYGSANIQKEIYTRDGDIVTLHMFGLEDERVTAGTGSHEYRADYSDTRGFIQTQFKEDGTPNVIFDYLPFETSVITRNEFGYLYQILQIDPESGAVIDHDEAGFAEMRLMFDEYGSENGWEFRNAKGQLANRAATAVDPGYARWLYEFEWEDQRLGRFRVMNEYYETADGSSFCSNDVVCLRRMKFDAHRNVISSETFGADGGLVTDPGAGYAKVELDYDAQGRRTEARYMGADGALRTTGVAVRRTYYDAAGAAITEEFDHAGDLIPAAE
ncbi:hypothetical protein [Kordiimonas sp.]|uniref:hypothetical protein n=1 Tax=Kordiimonas sp. TaxID=1970157 RepID=UPI003A919A25